MNLLKKYLEEELKIKDESICRKFETYNRLLLEWNSKINLISRSSESIEAQVLNSIFFLTKYKIPEKSRIADIGTGGGFPGIPLKILNPGINLVLIDSIRKKMTALQDITDSLNLDNTEVFCSRVETFQRNKTSNYRCDIITAKSVATLDKLFSWTKNLLNENGEMIYIKGGDISEELNILDKKEKNISVEVIEFSFDSVYGIEDKKIVLIKKIL